MHQHKLRSVLASLTLCAGTTFTLAQDQNQPRQPFEAAELGVEPVSGAVELTAASAWVWKAGDTQRVALEREVSVVLAGTRVTADRAVLWILRDDESPRRVRVFGVFENMRALGTIRVQGDAVPVRAVVDLTDALTLRVDARFVGAPDEDAPKQLRAFIADAQTIQQDKLFGGDDAEEPQLIWAPRRYDPDADQLAQDAQRVLDTDPATDPRTPPKLAIGDNRPGERDAPLPEPTAERDPAADPSDLTQQQQTQTPLDDPRERVFAAQGIFSLSVGGTVVVQGERAGRPGTVTIDGGITLQYQDPVARQTMDLKADRGVIYLREGAQTGANPSTLSATQIEGIYLEGGVFAGRDDWSVRSPRVYIDLERDKMLMLDAVFWTIDERRAMPLYFRADEVRQTALGQFNAQNATIASSSFFTPDLNVGVSDLDVTITNAAGSGVDAIESAPGQDAVRKIYVEGRNVTMRLGSVPFFWIPKISSDGEPIPLRDVRIGDSNRAGFGLRTRWDAYSLFGFTPVEGVDVDLLFDYYTERGVALGVKSDWDTPNHRGGLYAYLLPSDDGTDILNAGTEITRNDEVRGIFRIEDIWSLQDPWKLIVKGNYISDEAFIPAFDDQLARRTPDFDSRVRLERTGEWTQFAAELSGSPNDFFAAEHRLLNPGFAVDKIPEATMTTLPREIIPDLLPFALTHESETRVGAMRLRFSEVTAAEYGFTTAPRSIRAFGTLPGVSLSAVQRAAGLDEGAVVRIDTRHELRAVFNAGPIKVTPFVTGRVTAYDTTFPTINPAQNDQTRLWGGAGVTLSTSMSRINNSVSSELLDIHRIRHIIEPSLTLWGADSNFAPTDTPIFDEDVEGLVRGTQVIATIDQTWQTKRGGVGQWRDADLLKVRTEIGWVDDRAGRSPVPDVSYFRPELSNPGNFISTKGVLTPTDALGFAGEIVYDRDTDKTVRSSAGVLFNQGTALSGSIEYRDLDIVGATFLSGGTRITLSEKYSVNSNLNYNFDAGDFQSVNAGIQRAFQSGTLGVTVRYDNLRGETSLGVFFRLLGTSGRAAFGAGGDFLRPEN